MLLARDLLKTEQTKFYSVIRAKEWILRLLVVSACIPCIPCINLCRNDNYEDLNPST